ncbi:MAG: pitrilysin family protein [Pseudomonadota bacterium]
MIRLLLITLIALSSPALAQEDKALNITEVTTEDGLSAWLVEDHTLPIIALDFAFKGIGAAHDPEDKQGLARMASNTMDEGAGDLNSSTFQKELQDLSISLGFSSSRDHFSGSVKTLSKNKARAFELLKLALTQPRFDEQPVERMRNANLSRIRSSLSNPDWISARLLNDKTFSGHAYTKNSGGTLTSLTKVTPDDLRAFTKNLTKDRLIVSASGDITAKDLKILLDNVFSDLPVTGELEAVPDLEQTNQGKTFLYEMDIPQTIIDMQQPGISRKDPNFQTAQVMNYILGGGGFGSRLMDDIREERGLTYGIYSRLLNLDHYAGLSVSTSTKNEAASEVIERVKVHWNDMREQPVTDQELSTAKSYLIGSLPLSLTSTDKISGLLLSLQLDGLPINYLDQREAAIQSTTKGDILELSKTLLNPESFTTILVGKPQGITGATKVESLPNVE